MDRYLFGVPGQSLLKSALAIGNVVKFSGNEVEITANDKPVFIKLTDSVRIYAESGGRMTNGSASDVASGGGSRMSNGNVADADATSLTLQYQGHSRTVSVPAGTPVVEYKVSKKQPATGDKIFLLVRKDEHDSLVSSKIVCF